MKKLTLIFTALLFVSCVSKSKSYFGNPLDKAVQAFQAQKTPATLAEVERLLPQNFGEAETNLQVLQVFEMLFQYYTEEQKDLAGGQKYFESLFANTKLNESQELDLQERISVIKEWRAQKKGAPPVTTNELVKLSGLNGKPKNNNLKWSENFYLKEIIRRFPGSKESQAAYKALASNVQVGYADEGGIPSSLMEMLLSYEILAVQKK